MEDRISHPTMAGMAAGIQPERQPRYLEIDDMLGRLENSIDVLFVDLEFLNGKGQDCPKMDNQVKRTKTFAEIYFSICERLSNDCDRIERFRTSLMELLK